MLNLKRIGLQLGHHHFAIEDIFGAAERYYVNLILL